MLKKKMLRNIRANFSQFFSIFILVVVAMWCFTGFQSDVIGGRRAMTEFAKESDFADGWIYGSGFTEEQAKDVKNISKINDVQLRCEVLGKADEEYNTAEIWCYFENDNIVTKPYTVTGADFDPDDTEGVWLFEAFADTWGLRVGDDLTVHVMGLDIEKEIKGLIESPEHIFSCASSDTDTDFHNIGFAYLSQKVLPEEMRINNEILFTCEGKALSYESKIDAALGGEYSFIADRKSIDGWNRLVDELNQHDSFSYIFSFVFVAIALLVITTTMKRMVARQRTQIGTLNALGMKNRKIMCHYLGYSFILSVLGCIAGTVLGIYTFGRIMIDMFSDFYRLPNWAGGFNYKSVIVAVIIVMFCTGAAFFSCRQILKIHPSEALRPATSKTAKPCVFEKLPFWDKLGFTSRYSLRDISRSKMRAVMGIFGTCVGMMLMTLGLGAFDTLSYVRGWYFDDIQNYSNQVLLSDICTAEEAEALASEYDGELVGMGLISIAASDHPVSDDIISCKLSITEGKGLFCVSDTELNVKPLKKGTVALTMKQAAKLGLKKGDSVYWKTADGDKWIKSEIGLISRHPSVTGITILREDYESEGFEFHPQMLVTKKDCSGAESRSSVSAVHSMDDLKAAFDKTMEVMDLLVYFMVFFSALLIIIVLYNSGNLSFNEREKEFATLKVMGFGSPRVRRLISVQNLWLSLIGAACGVPFGKRILQAMMDSNGDAIDWPCSIKPLTYLLSGAFVMGISVLVGFMFSKRIKKIDMVGVLKGME